MENSESPKNNSGLGSTEPKKEAPKGVTDNYAIYTHVYKDTVKDLNAKILKMTMMIREDFPELSKFLNEMPVTVPDEQHPEVELDILKKYYDSLSSLFSKYRIEHPQSPQK